MADNPGPDETIEVKRRRQGASSGPHDGERAEAPSRRQEGGSRPSGGGFGGGGLPGGDLPGGGLSGLPRMPLWMILLLVVGYFLYSTFFSGGSNPPDSSLPAGTFSAPQQSEQQSTQQSAQQSAAELPIEPSPTARPASARPTSGAASASTTGQTWTVMLYQDADDPVLEQDILTDLNEAERVGSTNRVQIVAQIDRYKGAYSGDGDWTSTRRYHLTQDNDLNHLHSEMVADLGELDMADGKTLTDFVAWAAKAYPADRYALILSDHGMGWPGGFTDSDPAVKDPSRAPLASALSSDMIYLAELDKALANITAQTSIGKFELIGMDACLMGHLEVLTALQPYARYAVLSQETEPAIGWAYTGFLQTLAQQPDLDGAELSRRIVQSYIQDDQRITDPQARADFLRQGSPLGSLFGGPSQTSAAALAQQMGRSATLTAVDLSAVPALNDKVNRLAYALQNEDQEKVAGARSYAPAFTNVFGKDGASPYIDLEGFAQMLKRQGAGAETARAADEATSAAQAAVIAEKHGPGKPGATGISIYFPTSSLYRSPVAGAPSYTAIAQRFAQVSLWDDFLAFHYNSVGFKAEPAQPSAQPGGTSRAPGAGQFSVSAIRLSANTAAPGKPVTLTARVSGKNIGYISLFAGYYDRSSNSIFVADTDYLESPKTQQLNGVYYPQWSQGSSFNLKLDWDPTVFQISDGKKSGVALFSPQTYGASASEAVYTVDGIYHSAGGASRPARMYFRDGVMRQVFTFTDANETGAAREVIPQSGDSFTILEKWLDLDSSGQVSKTATQEGDTFTFGSQPFTWKEVYAAPGDYIVGFILQDMDGASQEVYTQVVVK